jgi:hypothetical protein
MSEAQDELEEHIDPETILLTLDQVSQTIDVLSNVVRRLQNYMNNYIDKQTEEQERISQGELPFIGGKQYH